jgi:hypothetical protein
MLGEAQPTVITRGPVSVAVVLVANGFSNLYVLY